MELKIPKRQNQNNVLPNTQIKYAKIMISLRSRFIGEKIHRERKRERDLMPFQPPHAVIQPQR